MLPPESVVVLNIPYWGAGVQPWCLGSGHKDFPHAPSISDQKLEVFCVYSSFHIAQMQVKNLTTYVTLFNVHLLSSKPLETRWSKQRECHIYVLEKLLLDIVVVDHLFCKFCKLLFWKIIWDCCHWSCFECFKLSFQTIFFGDCRFGSFISNNTNDVLDNIFALANHSCLQILQIVNLSALNNVKKL